MSLKSPASAPALTGYDIARELREIASHVRRLPPPSARRPEAFHEDRSEVAGDIVRLARRIERQTRARR